MNDLLTEIITRIQMVKERGYEPRGIILHPSRKDELVRCCIGNENTWLDRRMMEKKPEELSGDLGVYGVNVFFDMTMPRKEILIAYDPSPPVNTASASTVKSEKMMASKKSPPLECQVDDPDNDPDIIDARLMKSIYSDEILIEIGLLPKRKLYFCEYCRQLVSDLDDHECEKGVH